MSFFSKANQIQKINSEIIKLSLIKDDIEKELKIKNDELDNFDTKFNSKIEINKKKEKSIQDNIKLLNNILEELDKETKKRKDNINNLKKDEKVSENIFKNKEIEINKILFNKNKEVKELDTNIYLLKENIDNCLKEIKQKEKQKLNLLEENKKLEDSIIDKTRFIKNLKIRETEISRREKALKKLRKNKK